MGCIICNTLEILGRPTSPSMDKCSKCADVENTDIDERLVAELKEEICNDIATQHPEMADRILEIVWTKYTRTRGGEENAMVQM